MVVLGYLDLLFLASACFEKRNLLTLRGIFKGNLNFIVTALLYFWLFCNSVCVLPLFHNFVLHYIITLLNLCNSRSFYSSFLYNLKIDPSKIVRFIESFLSKNGVWITTIFDMNIIWEFNFSCRVYIIIDEFFIWLSIHFMFFRLKKFYYLFIKCLIHSICSNWFIFFMKSSCDFSQNV